MKKLLTLATIAAAVPLIAVESANIVGYTTQSTTSESVMWTPQFNASVTGSGMTYALSDFTATGMDLNSDYIQFLDADTLEAVAEAIYLDEETYGEYAGWWDFNGIGSVSLNDQSFPFATAFLSSFTSGNEITMSFAGSVIKESRTLTTSSESIMFGNYLPRDLTLADITSTGMDVNSDYIQILDPDTLDAVAEAIYLDEETYGEYAGWWDFNGIGSVSLNDTPVPAGQGFLASFTSGNEITITFPAAY